MIPRSAVPFLAAALAAAVVAPASASPAPEGGKEEAPKATPYKEQYKDEILLKGARGPLKDVEVMLEGYDKVDWKYHWVKVYLATGTAYKDRGEAWLRTVCEIVRSMTNLGEVARANKERDGLGKAFEALRDQADTALRGIGKEGCK